MPTTSPMYFLVSFNIIFNNFNPRCFGAPYCLEKKKIISNPIHIVFLACLFNILAIAYCYCHSPSFIILGIVWVHFFLFTKFKSFLNQNNGPIEILNKDVQIWERLLGSYLSLGFLFKTLA